MDPERQRCLDASLAVEQALRQQLRPAKIKLAALGNMVSHLHWHGLARCAWDSHFPAPVWAAAQRGTVEAALSALSPQLPAAQQQSSEWLQPFAPWFDLLAGNQDWVRRSGDAIRGTVAPHVWRGPGRDPVCAQINLLAGVAPAE